MKTDTSTSSPISQQEKEILFEKIAQQNEENIKIALVSAAENMNLNSAVETSSAA